MPKPGDVPSSLQDFIYLNAAPVDVGVDFHQHVDRLIRSMDRLVEQRSLPEEANPYSQQPNSPYPQMAEANRIASCSRSWMKI